MDGEKTEREKERKGSKKNRFHLSKKIKVNGFCLVHSDSEVTVCVWVEGEGE